MSEASSDNSAPRQYALIELVRLMTEGGRPTTLGALKEACRSGALPSREVRGALVVTHDDFMAWLKGPHRTPGPGEAGQDPAVLAREALAQLKTRLKVERDRRLVSPDEKGGGVETEAEDVGKDSRDIPVPDSKGEGSSPGAAEEETDPVPAMIDKGDSPAGDDPAVGDTEAETEPGGDCQGAGATPAELPALEEAPCSDDSLPGSGEASEGEQENRADSSEQNPLEEKVEGPGGLVNTFFLERLEDGTTRRHGPCLTHYPDGTLAAEGQYRHGLLHGPWKQWFANGTLQCEGAYRDGLQEGRWVIRDASGNPLQEGEFHLGEARGLWREYHGNGKLWRECHYDKGIVTGEVKYFDVDGMPLEDAGIPGGGSVSPEETS